MSFAVSCRHRVPRRFENQAANHRDHHAEKNNGGGVIRDYVVDRTGSSGKARHNEIFGDADNQHREGANRQDYEARKNEDVKDPRGPVARLLPLPQPKFQNPSQSDEWPVKAKIAFAPKERDHAHRHNVEETQDTQKMNG